MHSFEDTQKHGRERCSRLKLGGDVDINDKEQHIQDEPSAMSGKEPKPSKTGNLVHSGPNKNITDNTKDGPFRTTSKQGNSAKLGPN